jgi:hypothetical protein
LLAVGGRDLKVVEWLDDDVRSIFFVGRHVVSPSVSGKGAKALSSSRLTLYLVRYPEIRQRFARNSEFAYWRIIALSRGMADLE